jgi:cupin 2 domain-containing protein
VHEKHDLFDGIPRPLVDEWTQRLAGSSTARVERIVSHGHASRPGSWYDQAESEWVMVVQGHARLRFEDNTVLELKPGQHVTIPARVRHRVEWTTPDEETIWLAVFF